MFSRMRHYASLLLTLFAVHLTMVAGDVMCSVADGEAVTGAASTGASTPVVAMADMLGMIAENAAAAAAIALVTGAGSLTDAHSCPAPASRICTAAMSCVTALGSDRVEPIARPSVLRVIVDTTVVLVPASSVSAPDIPPPRA